MPRQLGRNCAQMPCNNNITFQCKIQIIFVTICLRFDAVRWFCTRTRLPLRPQPPRPAQRVLLTRPQLHLHASIPPSCAGVNEKTACGVPAAAHISWYWSKSPSINVRIGDVWPTGGTPPMAKPVRSRTNSASAFASGSPTAAAARWTSTRLAPLTIRRMGSPLAFPRKTSDFAICPTSQPIAFAASSAVRVEADSSRTCSSMPAASNAALHTLCTGG